MASVENALRRFKAKPTLGLGQTFGIIEPESGHSIDTLKILIADTPLLPNEVGANQLFINQPIV